MSANRVLMPLPAVGYECTEAAVPWRVLHDAGFDVVFATPAGEPATVDHSTSTGKGVGLLGFLSKAAGPAFAAYQSMIASEAYRRPMAWKDAAAADFNAIVIPGGHHQEMAPFLASRVLQALVAEMAGQGKLVASICHGVLLVARSHNDSGESLLAGRKVTTVPAKAENQVHKMFAKKIGHPRFGKPNDLTAEEEIRELMGGDGELVIERMPLRKDAAGKEHRGLCFVDENFVTARMPHDAWCFAKTVREQLQRQSTADAHRQASA